MIRVIGRDNITLATNGENVLIRSAGNSIWVERTNVPLFVKALLEMAAIPDLSSSVEDEATQHVIAPGLEVWTGGEGLVLVGGSDPTVPCETIAISANDAGWIAEKLG